MAGEASFPRFDGLYPLKGWEGVPDDVEGVEIHGQVVRDFAPLASLAHLRTLRAVCDTARQLAVVSRLVGLEALALEHLGARGLAELAALPRLRALKLDVFRAPTLEGVERQRALTHLHVFHAPRLASLDALAGCEALEELTIMTPPSWDASRKTIRVATLAPLAGLRRLRRLRLIGVEPLADGLEPLYGLAGIEEVAVSHVPSLDVAAFEAARARRGAASR